MRPYSFILYEFLSVDKTDDVFGMESVPSMKFPEKRDRNSFSFRYSFAILI